MTAPNWDLFRLFSVVARAGSVNRAAHELGMSQPTLSRRLKELEQHIGAPLFFRASSGVKLTQEGEALRLAAGDITAAFESFQLNLRSQVGQRSSVVKVSTTEGLTKHWLLPRVKKLRALNGRVQLEITSTVQQQGVAVSDLDFVIRMGDPGENELIGKKVAVASFGVFASEKYLAGRAPPKTTSDLRGHDIIGNASDFVSFKGAQSNRMQLFGHFATAAETGSVVRVNPVANHMAAAVEGLGLALLAVPFAHAEGLVRVLPQESSSLDVWLLRRQESDLRKLTRQVRRFLESEFASSKDWFAGNQKSPKLLRR